MPPLYKDFFRFIVRRTGIGYLLVVTQGSRVQGQEEELLSTAYYRVILLPRRIA